MKIVEAHNFPGVRFGGYTPYAGSNPNIQIIGADEADYVWYCSWGDSEELKQDLQRVAAAAREKGKRLISVIRSDWIYYDLFCADDELRHFAPSARDFTRQIPYHSTYRDPSAKERNRTVLVSFRGSLNTYGPRQLLPALASPQVVIERFEYWEAPVQEKDRSYAPYCELMRQSRFTLCPRGNGKSSQRLYDAMRFYSIPVMIDDETRMFGQPMDFAIRASFSQLPDVIDRLQAMPDSEYQQRFEALDKFSEEFLEMDFKAGCETVHTGCQCTEYIRKTVESIER